MNTAFVTGATGFIGLNLVEQLRADGWHVVALHRSDKGLEQLRQLGAEPVQGSIDDGDSVLAAMPDAPDAVFHVAASTSLWRQNDDAQIRTNVGGTRNVVAAALERRAGRFIHTSSVAAWGDAAYDGMLDESKTPRAEDHWICYFRTKWEAEREVEAGIGQGLDAVFINPANVVGPQDDHNWSRLIAMLAEKKLPGIPPGAFAWCHVREVARAHISAFHKGVRGERYIVGGVNASYAEFIRLAATELGVKPPPVLPGFMLRLVANLNQLLSHVTRREPDITPEGGYLVRTSARVDSGKAERELGFQSLPLETLVKDTIAWMRATGQL